MKSSLLALLLAGCVADGFSTSTLEHAATSSGCRPALCGLNASELTDGYFHELNLDGLANEDGFSILGASKSGTSYQLAVTNGKITATRPGILPITLSGSQLVGLEIRLHRQFSVGNTGPYRILKIESVGTASYWAVPPNPGTHRVETYKLSFAVEGSSTKEWVCDNGQRFHNVNDPMRAMGDHHALVFEGDRINVHTLEWQHIFASPGQANRWFNIGCAETAIAKLHLNGRTKAARSVGFSSTTFERQAFLKMLTADYCGTGESFTVGGQRLRWRAPEMTFPTSEAVTLEAWWDEGGATCLNVPRLTANPTPASQRAFPEGPEAQIATACGGQLPPPCGQWGAADQLRSYNPQL